MHTYDCNMTSKKNLFFFFLPELERNMNTKEKQTTKALYCHHFPLIFPQSLFKTWHLPLTTGHYVSTMLQRGSFTVHLKINTHYQAHKTCCEKYTHGGSDRGSAFPVSFLPRVIMRLCTDPEPALLSIAENRNRFSLILWLWAMVKGDRRTQ